MAIKSNSRRKFIKSAAAIGSASLVPTGMAGTIAPLVAKSQSMESNPQIDQSLIGNYGPYVTGNLGDPPSLSFRHPDFDDLEKWRPQALKKTMELVAPPSMTINTPRVTTKDKFEYDGLQIELLEWQLGYGRPTEAVFMKPVNAKGTLPGVLGLHDHGGQKYFGKRKISRTSDKMHPMMEEHYQHYYSGHAWGNELAKNGYAVLVHDTFTFGSRRVLYQDITGIEWGPCRVDDKTDENPEDPKNIEIYNTWAANHEHIMAKSLFCAGTTWPAMTLVEDQVALDILSARSDVDENNLGCCGLSGGGLRTDYLGGLDHRVKCAVSVGFMSTWRDFLLNKSQTHTWMAYTPLLPNYLDFPEVLGLRVPLPTMVLNDNEDDLYTLPEMHRADKILKAVYEKAGVPDNYKAIFYPGEHKFDAQMQKDAFDWFDKWLKG